MRPSAVRMRAVLLAYEFLRRAQHPPLKFLVLIAGFLSRDHRHEALWMRGNAITVPTVHMWGERDPLKGKSESAVARCAEAGATVMVHGAGHKVPHVGTIDVEKIRALMASATKQPKM